FKDNKVSIKFYDNTRSLVHSNGFILQSDRLTASFRCSLLDLPESQEKLSENLRQELKAFLEHLEPRVNELPSYFIWPKIALQMKKMNPGWMDPEAIVSSLFERFTRLKKALENPEATTLE